MKLYSAGRSRLSETNSFVSNLKICFREGRGCRVGSPLVKTYVDTVDCKSATTIVVLSVVIQTLSLYQCALLSSRASNTTTDLLQISASVFVTFRH